MYLIKALPEFNTWLASIKDGTTRMRLGRRIDKAQRGLLGDVKPVGDGIYEMREHFGPGWRIYYKQHGEILIILLGGGDKSTQTADITKAITLASKLEE